MNSSIPLFQKLVRVNFQVLQFRSLFRNPLLIRGFQIILRKRKETSRPLESAIF